MAAQSKLDVKTSQPSFAASLLLVLVRAYQILLSPWLGGRCRHQPSCSEYALQALRTHGAWRGAWLTVRRLSRCHPWGSWGYDPVPPASG